MMRSDSLPTPTPKRYLSGSCAIDCAIDKVIKDGVKLNKAEDYSFSLEFDNFSISGIPPAFFDKPVGYAGLTSQVEQRRCTATKYQVKPVVAKENPTNNESLVSRPNKHVEAARCPRSKECSPVDDDGDYIYMHSCPLPISKRGSRSNNDSGYTHMQRTTKNDAAGDSLDETSSQSGKNSSVSEKQVKVLPPNAQAVCNTTSNDSKLTFTAAELQRAVFEELQRVVFEELQRAVFEELQRAELERRTKSASLKKHSKKTRLFNPKLSIFECITIFEKLKIEYDPSKKEESLKSLSFMVVKIHKATPEHKIDLIIQVLAYKVAENEKLTVASDIKPSLIRLNESFFELFFRTCGFSTAKYQSPQQISGVTIDKIEKRLYEQNREQESFLFKLLVEGLKVRDAPTY